MKPRTLAGAELLATMTVSNVEAPPDRRGLPRGIGWPEILFATGFLMVATGLALVWLPLGLVFAGAMLAFVAWKLA